MRQTFIFLVTILGCHFSSFSQSDVLNLRMIQLASEEINLDVLGVADDPNPLSAMSYVPSMNYRVFFELSSVLEIDSIKVNILVSDSTIMNAEFGFDEEPTPPLEFVRDYERVQLGLGDHPYFEAAGCEVQLVFSNGLKSEVFSFSPSN